MKIIILGGRSGTSALYRILRTSGFRAWGHTEPPGVAGLILDNLNNRPAIREGLAGLDGADLAKCPEFAFCTSEIVELYPDSRFIWLDRPLIDRVESHAHMGWDLDIHEKILSNCELRKMITATLSPPTDDPKHNDLLYFRLMDELNRTLEIQYPYKILRVQYSDFDRMFLYTMQRIANFLNIPYNKIWEQVKQMKHQGGRWPHE